MKRIASQNYVEKTKHTNSLKLGKPNYYQTLQNILSILFSNVPNFRQNPFLSTQLGKERRIETIEMVSEIPPKPRRRTNT